MEIKLGEKAGKKTQFFVNGELIGPLYPKEIKDYALEDEGEIEERVLCGIIEETLLPRAKRYVMNLLVKSDKTETELKRKLKQAGYGEAVSEGAIEYVRGFHYIDELRTAESYIRTKMDFSSEKEIRYKLSEKGIDTETIDMAYDQIIESLMPDSDTDTASDADMEILENTELKAAENFVRKKLGSRLSPGRSMYSDTDTDMDTEADADRDADRDEDAEGILTYEEKQKLMAAAFRKGFRQDSIRSALARLLSS